MKKKSIANLIVKHVSIIILSVISTLSLASVISDYTKDPFNSQIRDLHMSSIYNFIDNSNTIYENKKIENDCYFYLNLNSVIDYQKDADLLKGFIIKEDGIYKYDYNVEGSEKEFSSPEFLLEVDIKKDDTFKTIFNVFNSDEINLQDYDFIKFIPYDNKYEISVLKDNQFIDLRKDTKKNLEENFEEDNEEENKNPKIDPNTGMPDYSSLTNQEEIVIEYEDIEIDFENYILAFNPKTKDLFISQNELTNFFVEENFCLKKKVELDLGQRILKNIESILDEYISKSNERLSCEKNELEAYSLDETYTGNSNCNTLKEEENSIKNQINVVFIDIGEEDNTLKEDFFDFLEKREDKIKDLNNDFLSVKNYCKRMLEIELETDEEEESKTVFKSFEDEWESICNNQENLLNNLNTMDENLYPEAYLELKIIYELNKAGCENEDLREKIFPDIFNKYKNQNYKPKICDIDKIQEFENFFTTNINFQYDNYDSFEKNITKYLLQKGNYRTGCYEAELASSFIDFFTEDDKEKICKYLSFEKNFFDENILPKGEESYYSILNEIYLIIEILEDFYFSEKI